MKYTPYTEAEIQSMNVMEAGVYTFQVHDVITRDNNNLPLKDKNGHDMAKLKLVVWDKEGKERSLITYMSGDGRFTYKLRHFAKTIGMIFQYEAGNFDIHQTIGKSGKADVIIKKGTMKTDGSGEVWPDRNDVKDFVVSEPNSNATTYQTPPLQSKENMPPLIEDEDVPF